MAHHTMAVIGEWALFSSPCQVAGGHCPWYQRMDTR